MKSSKASVVASAMLSAALIGSVHAQDNPFDTIQQVVQNIFGGSADPNADAASPPVDMGSMMETGGMMGDYSSGGNEAAVPILTINFGNLLGNLNDYMSGVSNDIGSWASSAAESDPAQAEQYDAVTQSMNNAVSQLQAAPRDFNDFTQGVLCDMMGAVNSVVDSGLGDFAFNFLPFGGSDDFDLQRFMGTWYQVYAGQFMIASMESNMACIKSVYEQTGDKTYHLQDSWTSTSKDQSTISSRTGNAQEVAPTQIRVAYDGEQKCLSHALRVLETGPINADGKYDWAIVSDPFSIAARVLARDPEQFKSDYESTVVPNFQNSFEGFADVMVPIDQMNCPNHDQPPAAAAPKPAPSANTVAMTTTTAPTTTVTTTTTAAAATATTTAAAASNANAVAAQQEIASPAAQDSSGSDDDNTALAIGLGVGLGLLALILLALLAWCCVRRRQQARLAVAVAAGPATKIVPHSNDKLLGGESKGCTYCQGPQCMYGGQAEHDLANKMENVDYSTVGDVTQSGPTSNTSMC